MRKGFIVTHRDSQSQARLGLILTPHGPIETPAFAPVASQGTVKALTFAQLEELGAQVILVNSYHLYLRPGIELIERMGGLHSFISWPKPIISDSGGFQIYSHSPLAKISLDGVYFSSHLDGQKIFLRPEDVVNLQLRLGTDIMMVLDYFVPYSAPFDQHREAVSITSLWAKRSKEEFKKKETTQQLWGICQGGTFSDLRRQSLEFLLKLDFDGYALGGLGLGEPKTELIKIINNCVQLLPEDKPRYLMGMGYISDILEAVSQGIDFFDCVLPTRNARTGTLFTSHGKIVIKQKKYAEDKRPIDEHCSCYTCRYFSRAYLRHLYERQEITSSILNTIHNLHFYLDIFRKIRQSIASNSFGSLKASLSEADKEKEE
ncbi:MAG: tRNA guanosine(34) transglycosylase Tgt [Candidatus Aminicenantes bacterium]|nr:tRNA guanosine(34) transglycosylase Tgt [Candidatus Aminicenantes bacterium]